MLALASISTGSLPGVRAPITPPATHMYMDVCVYDYMCVYVCVYVYVFVCEYADVHVHVNV